MGVGDQFFELKDEIREIKERLRAIEKEQRLLVEDILSGEAEDRIRRRILDNNPKKDDKLKEKIEEINIKI